MQLVKKPQFILSLIILLALFLRLSGIEKESLWFDETCSIAFSDHNIHEVLSDSAKDIHPPLYYLGLHFWRNILSDSPTCFRSYSLIFSLFSILIIYFFTKIIAGKNAALVASFFAAIHPFDIYFAQETRGYTQTATLALATTFFLYLWIQSSIKNKGSKKQFYYALGYVFFATTALYSHYLALLLLISQGIFALSIFIYHKNWKGVIAFLGCTSIIALSFLPWYFFVLKFRDSLFLNQNVGWMVKPHLYEIFTFLGKEVLVSKAPFEIGKTSKLIWTIPIVFFAMCFFFNLTSSDKESSHSKTGLILLTAMLFLPVLLAVLISFLYNPIYSSSRFSMFVLPYFIILISVCIYQLSKNWFRNGSILFLCIIWILISLLQFQKLEKEDWKRLKNEIPKDAWPTQIIYYPETYKIPFNYYFPNHFQRATTEKIKQSIPYMKDGEIWVVKWNTLDINNHKEHIDFFEWLKNQGSIEEQILPCKLKLIRIKIYGDVKQNFWYPLAISNQLSGFQNLDYFHNVEVSPEGLSRWSKENSKITIQNCNPDQTVELEVNFPPPLNFYKPNLQIFAARYEKDFEINKPIIEINDYKPGNFKISIPVPKGKGKLHIAWRINTINLAQHQISNDDRDLGLRIHKIMLR